MASHYSDLPRVWRRRHPPTPPRARRSARANPAALSDDLSCALHLWPSDINLECAVARGALLRKLGGALRAQRASAIAGAWHYDVAAHAHILDLYHRLKHFGRRRQLPCPSPEPK